MENQIKPQPVLVGQGGPLNGYRWAITKPLLIGRTGTCDISISNQQVSRKHARIFISEKGPALEDLGSKNGTYHNGKPVTGSLVLEDGDIIQIALAQEFIYLGQDATIPLAPDEFDHSFDAYFRRIRLDKDTRQTWVLNQEIAPPLSALQFQFLVVLSDSRGRVISRSEIINAVWGPKEAVGVTDQALDALVRRLRDRLAEYDDSQEYIITVRGQGFRLDNPSFTG